MKTLPKYRIYEIIAINSDLTYPQRVRKIYFQVFTNSCHWKAETVKDYKSTRRIAFTAKHVISKIRAKTLIGSCLRAAVDLLMMACKVDHLIRIENVRMCNIIHRSKLPYSLYFFACAQCVSDKCKTFSYNRAKRNNFKKCLCNITF